ncbi:hypothetical protein IFR05_003445 [Cadophora sp. M221]|nr:hypothetical protein IFR05_003445 [Cadophora sp. M221]
MDRQMAKRQVALVNAKNESLRKEIGQLTDDAETDRMYTDDLHRRFKEKTWENEKLIAEAKSLPMGKLELEMQLREPLFQIGVDVHTRYLEQAKESLWHVKTWDKRSGDYILQNYEFDSVAIERGNQAAHSGNRMADGSLFVLGKLSRQWATKDVEHKFAKNNSIHSHWRKPLATEFDGKSFRYGAETLEPEQSNIFEDRYHYRPAVYVTMPTKLLEVIDCEATIRTLKSLSDGLDRPLIEKQQVLKNVSTVVDKYPKLPKGEFDTGVDVIRRVDRVKALTEMIVIYD